MHAPTHRRPPAPELEHALLRNPDLGYEPPESGGFLRCLDHGFPNPLVRWHYHDEYELHLIVATSGKVFVGDYIGHFSPGHLVLTGPRLPHNWISTDAPPEGVALRDRVVQFAHEPLEQAAQHITELREVLPLLERARHGIEFFGLSDLAYSRMEHIRASRGLARLAAFCEFLTLLARSSDYRLLSSVQLQSFDDDESLAQINAVVSYVSEHCAEPLSMAEVCRRFHMTESRFSRFFRRATGNTFTDFVNRMRISKACELLMQTDRYVTNICYDVGFNNVANFNRRFLEIKGMTPTDFRRQAEVRFGAGT
ncbi:AraC family transcriptional regulator [Ideonella sp. BN130291]|uniref:AraC family transcriptional regulator n=1 Tax=Ideonella sp. BN130291 TaxID=3112940 RepID=UPI002E275D95|nr:AraC family transcriptional regulator [Ideonella sp. BN130291]